MKFSQRHFILTVSVFVAIFQLAGCSGSQAPDTVSTTNPDTSMSASSASAAISVSKLATYTPASNASAITSCNIETFDDAAFQAGPGTVALAVKHSVAGWIAAPQMSKPTYWLRLDDEAKGRYLQTQINMSVARPDVVAAVSGASIPLISGFKLELPANEVPAGNYHIYLAAAAGSTVDICDSGRNVNFK